MTTVPERATVEHAASPLDASPLDLQIVTQLDDFDALRDEWTAAVDADPDTNVFLTWPWARTWWSHFRGDAAGDDATLHIVVVRDADGVVAIAPLFRSRVGVAPLRARALQRISHDAGDCGGIVLVRRAGDAVSVLVDHLAGELVQRDVEAVVLSRLASDARFSTLLGDELARRSADVATVAKPLAEACLFTDVRGGFDLAERAKRHKIRQRRRRLDEQYDDVRVVAHSGDTLESGLDHLVTLHEARWAELGQPLRGLLASPRHRAFLLDAVGALDAEGKVRLLTLEAGGRPAAVELDFRLGPRLFLFKGTFHPDFAPFTPSQLLTHHAFEAALADGVEVVDFCRGGASYKRRWTNSERHLTTVTLTRAGRTGAAALRRFRLAQAAERRLRRDQTS